MVYPGFLQLTGFMTMNLDRHMKAHRDLFDHLVDGDGDSADKHREFYDEYLAVMDLTGEFYLQTVDTVFVRHLMAKGEMTHRGRPVDLTQIRRVALMTVEGEKDDITGKGQCRAAHTLCTSIPRDRKQHFECPRVGHYGIFNGARFRAEIAPRIATFVRDNDPRTAAGTGMPALDRATAVARAKGHTHELATAACSVSAANDADREDVTSDCTTVASAEDARAHQESISVVGIVGVACLNLWQFAGSLFFGGLSRPSQRKGGGLSS
jgi:poly(3-hydroxybutyrate) depolymerase